MSWQWRDGVDNFELEIFGIVFVGHVGGDDAPKSVRNQVIAEQELEGGGKFVIFVK